MLKITLIFSTIIALTACNIEIQEPQENPTTPSSNTEYTVTETLLNTGTQTITSDTETDTVTQTQTQSNTITQTNQTTQTKTDSVTQTQTQTQTQTISETETSSQTHTTTQTETETETQTQTQPQTQTDINIECPEHHYSDSNNTCIPNRFDQQFIIGMDISSIAELNDYNVWFVDTDGVGGKSMLDILKNHGVNYIRLRTFVDPFAMYGYSASDDVCTGRAEAYNDKQHTIEFAKQVKAKGMGFLLDIQYSDSWTDPDSQVIPESWRHITTLSEMKKQINAYTTDLVQSLINEHARPDMIQIGNEITSGTLIHIPTSTSNCYGENLRINDSINGSAQDWDTLAQLLQAGSQAVKQVDSEIPVMMHIENSGSLLGMQWWVDNAFARHVEFDILGLSAYETFQGPSNQWHASFHAMAQKYPNLKFAIVEYNQQMTLLNDIMHSLPNQLGLGTFFWEPTQSGYWGDALFDWSGNIATANIEKFKELDALTQKYLNHQKK